MDLTLVIMAAGMSSRFGGGAKQIEPVGPNGELIMDYAVYDAVRAGFNKVVFVIKREMEQSFKPIYKRFSNAIHSVCAYQDLYDLPHGLISPPERVKPWGTAHAVYAARREVHYPFAVINADDFYGRQAFFSLAEYLSKQTAPYHYCMVGYELGKTLSEKGSVSRGVCVTDEYGVLKSVTERTKIERSGRRILYTENGEVYELSENETVSMNCWGFTPDFFDELDMKFPIFYNNNRNDLLKAEYYLPSAVKTLIDEKKAAVQMLKCNERWYGFTYREEKETVVNAINDMIEAGVYPRKLF